MMNINKYNTIMTIWTVSSSSSMLISISLSLILCKKIDEHTQKAN